MIWPKEKNRTSALVLTVPMQEAGQSITEVQTIIVTPLSTSIYRLYRRISTTLWVDLLVKPSLCMNQINYFSKEIKFDEKKYY